MARVEDIGARMAAMGLDDKENEGLCFGEEAEEASNKFKLCLVGRFLTEKSLNIRAMKSKLADIWRPVRGINIKDLKPGIFLFQFYHIDDMQWVLSGGPWSFDGAMLIISIIDKGMDPLEVPLFELSFWIQLHGLPNGFMTEAAGKQLGDFFGSFQSYDPNNNTSIWRECMRIKIKIDVRKPLKRKKKICRRNGAECIVQCKYERLGNFCFTCGMVTHIERFCNKRLGMGTDESLREWGVWLRAPQRRMAGQERSKWLRDERDEDWGVNYGSGSYCSTEDGVKQQSRSGIRHQLSNEATIPGSDCQLVFPNMDAGNNNFKPVNGPSAQELIGLNMDARKRRRGADKEELMEIEGGHGNSVSEHAISSRDFASSSLELLAQLAKQASQSQ